MPSGFSICWLIALVMAIIIGTPAFLVNLKKLNGDQSSSTRTGRFKAIGIILTIFFIGLGLFRNIQLETRLTKSNESKIFTLWGTNNATVNTVPLNRYMDRYSAMVIFRVQNNAINSKTDPDIAKSFLFDIDGNSHSVEINDQVFLSRVSSVTAYVEVYLAIIPKTTPAERINCLADVESNGGRIIGPNSVIHIKKV